MTGFEGPRKLVAAFRARGLEPLMAVRVSAHPTRKLPVAEALALLFEDEGVTAAHGGVPAATMAVPDLARLVEGGGLALPEASHERAEAFALALRRAGGNAVVEHARTERFAGVRHDPGRGPSRGPGRGPGRAPSCEWLAVSGRDLFLTRGQPWAWTGTEVLARDAHLDVLVRAVDETRARWAAAGLSEADDESGLLAMISPREPELEQRMRTAKGTKLRDTAAVYADWLQNHGDPRGLLGVAALADTDTATATDTTAAAAVEALLAAHGPAILGGAAGAFEPDALTWVGPCVLAARLSVEPRLAALGPGHPSAEAAAEARARFLVDLRVLLELPACAALRELGLSLSPGPSDNHINPCPTLPALIADSRSSPSLRRLWIEADGPRWTGVRFERLEHLALRVRGNLMLGPSELPRLRRLELRLRFPKLELTDILRDVDAPKLETLDLDWAGIFDVHAPPLEQIATALTTGPFEALRHVELPRMQLRRGASRSLLDLARAAPLRSLGLGRVSLDPGVRDELEREAAKLPRLEFGAEGSAKPK